MIKKIKFDDVTNENNKEINPNCPEIPVHLYLILIIGGSWFTKGNSLFNLVNQ